MRDSGLKPEFYVYILQTQVCDLVVAPGFQNQVCDLGHAPGFSIPKVSTWVAHPRYQNPGMRPGSRIWVLDSLSFIPGLRTQVFKTQVCDLGHAPGFWIL